MTDLYDLPGHMIRRLHQISVSLFAARMGESGIDLTPVQFAALAKVQENPGVDQATLAGLIAHDRVTIGGVVDRLVAKGFLTREVSQQDRRARVLNLSPEGRRLFAAALPVAISAQNDITSGLTPAERATFMDLLRKATEAGNGLSRAPLVPAQRRTPDRRAAATTGTEAGSGPRPIAPMSSNPKSRRP